MTSFKEKIESGFESLAELVFRLRWPLLIFMSLLVFVSVKQLPHLTIDMSDEGFLHPDDPILQTYNEFRDQFGRDDLIVLAIHGDVFSQSFLKKLRKLHKDLEDQVPHVDEITSMVNARNTRGVTDGLIVEDLLEKWPRSPQELEALRERVMANPLYLNRLISEDGAYTTLLIQTDAYGDTFAEEDILDGFDDFDVDGLDDQAFSEESPTNEVERVFLTNEQRNKLLEVINGIAAQVRADDFQISIAGSPVVTDAVKNNMRKDMMLFLRLALLIIAFCLFLMFRRVSPMIMPLLVVGLALTSTLALMVVTGTAVKMPTMILPSFLLAVGVGDSVHILIMFFQHFNRTNNKKESIVHALGHSGFAVVMTSLTTAAGLLSFAGAEVAPISDLGIFASVGVMLAMLYSIIFLPAMLAVVPLKTRKISNEQSNPAASTMTARMMDGITNFSTGHARGIIIFSLLVMAIAVPGILQLQFSHNILTWLPEDMPVRLATQTIDSSMKGSVTLEVILDTGRENGLYEPAILNKIEQFTRELETDEKLFLPVGKAMSVTDILKEIHQALHENRAEYYIIPQDAKLIPQEFLLFENSGSDDLEDVIDSRFQLARITIKVPWQDAMNYVPFIKEVKERAERIFGSDADLTVTGIMALFGRIMYASIHSAGQSYLIAFAVITVMMMFLIGSIRLGLLCMFPNLAPIVITMGFMGWVGLPLDMFTMLIGSIAIGIAVDDTVHFVYNFRRYFARCGDPVESVRQTLQSAGKAMLTTTIVLSTGFFIFMFASMSNLFNFGMLTGMALILALAADLFLAPALFTLVSKSRVGRAEIVRR